ncbi:MAG: TetR/AcrR family transcriptional regulator [Phycisphaerales bacterium]
MAHESATALRDRMLDAAEAVVVRQGIANLTLEAVAAEAGMSKGGLLHYFPNKDSLVEALVIRCAEYWREGSAEAYEAAPAGPGRMARALLAHLADEEGWTEQCQRSSSAAFAALAQNPRLIEPMRAVYTELRQRVADDGHLSGVSETILVAMDGLWLNRVLGLAPVDKQRMDRIRRTLETMLQLPATLGEHATKAKPGAAPRSRRAASVPRSKPVRRSR